MSQVMDVLEAARQAAAGHAWREAYDAFARAADELGPEDLERFADAAWWTGRLEEAIDLRERAYAGFAGAPEPLAGARVALTLAWDHIGRSAFAVSRGWLANAERLLEGQAESAEHGRVLLTRGAFALFGGGSLDDALALFGRAHEIGKRAGERDLEVLALVAKGRALLLRGDVDEGLALLDEGTAAAVCGAVKPYATGLVYCMTISSCQDVGDFRRAAEWTDAANRWCDRLDVTGFPGACRVHRAEIMRLRGDWPRAEQQALAACEELHDFDRYITAAGYYEVGEIRRRRGDFAAAEEAFRTANELGRQPQPGLALLRLGEGKIEPAVAGIGQALAEEPKPLVRMRLLPAQAEIAIAAGDLRTAREVAVELEQIADSYRIGERRGPALAAAVHLVHGRIKLAEGDAQGAVRCLRRARDEWLDVGAPYETAQARMLLGLAFRRHGDEHAATTELDAALATFERLGGRLDEERTKELLGRLQTRRTFVFTDIVDSTRLMATLGNEKWRKLLARHDDLLRQRIVEHGGDVIKQTGDGFFAAYDNPRAAIESAIAIQRALDAEIVAPDVRIGAHTGGAFQTGDDFSDYGGQGVHVAARIGAAADPGEILVSRETLAGVEAPFRLSEPRTERLQGFDESIELVSVRWR